MLLTQPNISRQAPVQQSIEPAAVNGTPALSLQPVPINLMPTPLADNNPPNNLSQEWARMSDAHFKEHMETLSADQIEVIINSNSLISTKSQLAFTIFKIKSKEDYSRQIAAVRISAEEAAQIRAEGYRAGKASSYATIGSMIGGVAGGAAVKGFFGKTVAGGAAKMTVAIVGKAAAAGAVTSVAVPVAVGAVACAAAAGSYGYFFSAPEQPVQTPASRQSLQVLQLRT